MSDNDNQAASELARTFTGMLGELEDVATRLTVRQSELARELADVEDELRRIEAVRTAMTGKPRRMPVSATTRKTQRSYRTNVRVEKVLAWARERGEEFSGRDVAELLGMETRGVGPILAGMTRRGELVAREDSSNHRFYRLA